MQNIVVKNGQNLLDAAILHCGSLEAAFEAAVANDISISDEPITGQAILMPDPINKAVVEYFDVNKYLPATNDTYTAPIVSEGIGFWTIGTDFIIQ